MAVTQLLLWYSAGSGRGSGMKQSDPVSSLPRFSTQLYTVRPECRCIHVKSGTKSLLTGWYTLNYERENAHRQDNSAVFMRRCAEARHPPISTALTQRALIAAALTQHKQSHIHRHLDPHLQTHFSPEKIQTPAGGADSGGWGLWKKWGIVFPLRKWSLCFYVQSGPVPAKRPVPRLAQAPALAGWAW